jgi:hypothetical protein
MEVERALTMTISGLKIGKEANKRSATPLAFERGDAMVGKQEAKMR